MKYAFRLASDAQIPSEDLGVLFYWVRMEQDFPPILKVYQGGDRLAFMFDGRLRCPDQKIRFHRKLIDWAARLHMELALDEYLGTLEDMSVHENHWAQAWEKVPPRPPVEEPSVSIFD